MTPGVYDNPDTMCREVYAHGFLVTLYTEQELETSSYRWSPVQEQFLKIAQSYGKFNEGMRYGDTTNIPEDTSAATPYEFNDWGPY